MANLREPWQWWLWMQGLVGSRYDGLRHFAVVAPGILYRCGQPRVSDLETIRRQHGLQTIVCARGGTRHPLRGRWFRKERRYCDEHNIRLEHMPFSDKSMPPEGVFDRFLKIIADAANHPVLVHCEQGFHRTGILCAAYRIGCDRWTLDRTLAEMQAAGFDPNDGKRATLRDALIRWAGQPRV